MCIAFPPLNRSWIARSASIALPLFLVSLSPGIALGQDATPPPLTDAPADEPPPPPAELPQPSEQNVEPAPTPTPQALPAGQWVYTSQYGWVFMPYAQNYTYVPAVGYPYEYAYYPTFGWRWLSAPWIYGVGPYPYWGPRGYVHYAWHARPWFTHRAYVGGRGHPVMRSSGHGFGHFGGHHHR